MRAALLSGLVAVSMIAAGCVEDAASATSTSTTTTPPRPTVIVVIDSGVNAYHDAFAGGSLDAADHASALGATARALAATGDYATRRSADNTFWTSITDAQLYAFNGTRLMGVSFTGDWGARILDESGHGTSVASVAAREAPDAIIVMAQVDWRPCTLTGKPSCFIDPSVARAMEWAANQSWVDVISVSLGLELNPPLVEAISPTAQEYLDASRLAASRGKLIVNAAGNEVAPGTLHFYQGPPWVITAGGAEPAQRGDALLAGKLPDVVANYTEWTATSDSVSEYEWTTGTSFSTPNVAGVLAQSLHEVRLVLNDTDGTTTGLIASGTLPNGTSVNVTSATLRAAMNLSATPFAATDWDPSQPISNDTLVNLFGPSAPTLVPAQSGWGYVSKDTRAELVRRALEHDLAAPLDARSAFMTTLASARETYWR